MTIEEAIEIVENFLDRGCLNKVQEIVFRQSWEGKSYAEIASNSDYEVGYIRDTGSKLWQVLSRTFGKKVTKNNIHGVLKQQYIATHAAARTGSTLTEEGRQQYRSIPKELTAEGVIANQRQDWADAVDVSIFQGRIAELATLKQWIVQDRCRLVALLGMGGIGKTALAVKLAQQVQDEFEYLIWRSLRNAPPLKEFLLELIQFLSSGQPTALPETVDGRISQLMECLRSSRCLLILDNTESILQAGNHTGCYRQGYEGYGQLLRCIAETPHHSCLVLTSREKPIALAAKEGETLPVRSLQLTGLQIAAGQEIFKVRGDFWALEDEWKLLIEHYAGNPLALKIVAVTIRDFFDSNIYKYLELLKQGTLVFDDIRNLLDRHFERLSNLEKEVMYWLAINREAVSLLELQMDFVPKVRESEILTAIASLQRRSLIEKNTDGLTQQPVVMEYITAQIVERACTEITTQEIALFNSHALIKATAKDYIRDTQVRLILQPVVDRLFNVFINRSNIETQLKKILVIQQEASQLKPGYAGGNILNILGQLQTDLSGYNFSCLTIWQADLRRVKLHNVSFQNADLAKSVFAETLNSVLSVAFSPDGQLLATGDVDCEIRLWQVAEGKQLFTCKDHVGWITSVAFSPDGRILASGSSDYTVKLWDIVTGQCFKTLSGHTDKIYAVAFSPDGQTLASSSADKTIKLWDMCTTQCLKTLLGHTDEVRSVAFSHASLVESISHQLAPQGQTLVSGSADKTLKLWDINTGSCVRTLLGHTSGVWSVAFSPDGQTLASGSADYGVKLWDASTGLCLKTWQEHTNQVRSVAFNPDGQTLASGGEDQVVFLWDLRTGERLKMLQEQAHTIWSVAFNPQGKILASGSLDRKVKLWDLRTGQCFRTLQGHASGIWSVAFSHQGKTLVSGGADHSIHCWNVSTHQYFDALLGHTDRLHSVAFSPDSQTLASGSADQTVKLWNIRTAQYLKTLSGHQSWVLSVAFSPNGQTLASSSHDQTLRLWDIYTGQCLKILQGHTNWVCSVAFSPDSTTLASGSADNTLKLWDAGTGQCLNTLWGHTSLIQSVAFSPDGSTLASSSYDQTVKLWDVSTGKCLQTLLGHREPVSSVAFNPDGRILASGSHDQTVRLWDIYTGNCVRTLLGHRHWIFSVTFSPDGQILASGSHDETIKLWDAETGEWLKTLRAPKLYEGMNITGVTDLSEMQKATLKALGAVELAAPQDSGTREIEKPIPNFCEPQLSGDWRRLRRHKLRLRPVG